jgi:hypothetical protein
MKGELLKRYTGKPEDDLAHAAGGDEGLDDLTSFGCLRGIRDRAIMLELRHKDGNIDSFPYAWLSRARFNPSEGIILSFGGETVTITGRNFNAEVRPNVRLFTALVRHRVAWIQESAGPTAFAAGRDSIVVELIHIK